MCSSFRSSFSLNASIGEQPAVTLSAGIYTPVAKLTLWPAAFYEYMLLAHICKKEHGIACTFLFTGNYFLFFLPTL